MIAGQSVRIRCTLVVLERQWAPYLSGANLSGADLSDADLSDANLSGANLTGVIGVTEQEIRRYARVDEATQF